MKRVASWTAAAAIIVAALALVATPRGTPLGQAAMQPTSQVAFPLIIVAPEPTVPPPTPVPTTPPPPPSDWLSLVNYYRSLGLIPPVSNNADWSYGDSLHAQYMVKNDWVGHSEDPSWPFYTAEGDQAARSSNVMLSSSVDTTDADAIEMWIEGPFHAVGVLDPKLWQTGFGSYRENVGTWHMGAALDVLRGLGDVQPGVTFPIFWPANGTVVPLRGYYGGEYPNPLSSCPGYGEPSGLPITIQLGSGGTTPSVSSHSFSQGGTPLEHCVYDETSYYNSDASAQSLGRAVLDSRDAIVLIPRQPLTPGVTYTVSLTANGQTYTSSFTVSASAPERAVTGGIVTR